MRKIITILATVTVLLAATTATTQASANFQRYKNPALTAKLFKAQLSRDRSFRRVTVTVYNPTLLIVKAEMGGPGQWYRIRSKVYKVSAYRLLMVTVIPQLGPEPHLGYVDTKYPL